MVLHATINQTFSAAERSENRTSLGSSRTFSLSRNARLTSATCGRALSYWNKEFYREGRMKGFNITVVNWPFSNCRAKKTWPRAYPVALHTITAGNRREWRCQMYAGIIWQKKCLQACTPESITDIWLVQPISVSKKIKYFRINYCGPTPKNPVISETKEFMTVWNINL